jgi:FlaA1/EpsC-like NDP-sugar epimerase
MGESVKIVDLARNLILLSGLQPDRDIKIQYTGARPGEKLYEEVSLKDESLIPTSHAKIKSYICPLDVDPRQMRVYLQGLKHIVEEQDIVGLVLLLKELIPDYNPTSRLLNEALQTASKLDEPMKSLETIGHAERPTEVRPAPAVLMN